MKAFCCDRCGKMFRECERKDVKMIFKNGRSYSTNAIDFCPKCRRELSDWVVGRR